MENYLLAMAVFAGFYALMALGLNVIFGLAGMVNLGLVGFFAIGAYVSALLTVSLHWPMLAGWAVAALFSAACGAVVAVITARLKGDYLAIVTLGFGEIIKVVLQNIDAVGAARGLYGVPSYANVFWVFGLAAVTVYFVWSTVNSTYGRGFIAVADDEVAAEAMGLDTTRYKIVAFAGGAFFAGVAGGLYAHLKGYINPGGFDFNKSIEIVVMVILGGMGRHVGVVAAAVLLTLLTELLRGLGDYRMILYSALLVSLMIARPQGLLVWNPRRKAA
jgi:branched-chain amino acid transport system permease protein